MRHATDHELIERAQRGDLAAIGELFSRYWRAARGVAFGVTGDFHSAEDAASEAFRQTIEGIKQVRDPSRFGGWLRTIAIREAREQSGRRARFVDEQAGEIRDRSESAEEACARRQLAGLVHQAVRLLPEALREAIALTYFEGYDPAAAAKFLGIPHGTLRRRLHDGRMRLRAAIEQLSQGSNFMNEERDQVVQNIRDLIAGGDLFQATRKVLGLRPPPGDLIDALFSQSPLDPRKAESLWSLIPGASEATAPVLAAVRQALPEYGEWALTAAGAWPPGFSEGPG